MGCLISAHVSVKQIHCCILAGNLAPLKEQKGGFGFQGRALGDEKVMKRARTCYITETQKGQETREEECQLTANIEAVSDQWFLSSLFAVSGTRNGTQLIR